jgi:hypothetical protein
MGIRSQFGFSSFRVMARFKSAASPSGYASQA